MKKLNVLAAVIAVLGVVFLISFLLNVTAYQFNLPEEAILLLITAVGFQGFLGYSNVHSSHLYSQHLISTMLWGLFQFGVLIFCTTGSGNHGYGPMACQFFAGFAFPRSAVVLQPNERQQMGKTADCRFSDLYSGSCLFSIRCRILSDLLHAANADYRFGGFESERTSPSPGSLKNNKQRRIIRCRAVCF